MRFTASSTAALAVTIPAALAQTSTECNPLQKTCPPDTGLSATSYTADFTQGSSANASWSAAAYTTIDYGNDGAIFRIAQTGQAPTITTDFFIFGGRVDITMKPAPGQGIVSSIVLESDDLDEIDWEFIGGDNGHVQSNFYGKGNTTTYNRVVYHEVATPQNTWHTYSVDWNSERIEYLIDGSVVRTLEYSSPLTVNGNNYPQTPMQLKLGSWAGGDASGAGTVAWAGGKVDYSQGPFDMLVKTVAISNYNPACSYKYGDNSGSWDSIQILKTGDSCSAADSSSNTASSSGSTSVEATATVAPTSSISVAAITRSVAPVSTTVIGSAYSTNSASISALNSGFSTAASSAPTEVSNVSTAASSAPTEVPNVSAGINGTTPGSGSNTVSGPSATSAVTASTGAASSNNVMAAGSLVSIILAFCLL